eukprot:644251-Hanusia_phi.AAC.1
MVHTWEEINASPKRQNFETGGLGYLMDDNFECWVCVKDHSCAVPADPYFCFVYDEVNKAFLPWGQNKDLRLVDDILID